MTDIKTTLSTTFKSFSCVFVYGIPRCCNSGGNMFETNQFGQINWLNKHTNDRWRRPVAERLNCNNVESIQGQDGGTKVHWSQHQRSRVKRRFKLKQHMYYNCYIVLQPPSIPLLLINLTHSQKPRKKKYKIQGKTLKTRDHNVQQDWKYCVMTFICSCDNRATENTNVWEIWAQKKEWKRLARGHTFAVLYVRPPPNRPNLAQK